MRYRHETYIGLRPSRHHCSHFHKRSHQGRTPPGSDTGTLGIFLRTSLTGQPVRDASVCASRSNRAGRVAAVLARGLAGLGARPVVLQHVAALKVRAVRGLLEHEVIGKVRGVVAHVKPSDEHVNAAAPARQVLAVPVDPEHAELPQLGCRQRVGRARVTPAHVPRILEKHGAHVVRAHLLVEQRPVEGRKLLLHMNRQLHARWQLDRPVVRRLDAPLSREGVDHQVLRPIRIHRAQTHGQHELRRLVGDLQRTKIGEAESCLLGHVDLGDEELQVLADVAAKDLDGARRQTISLSLQPGDQTSTLGRRENLDVGSRPRRRSPRP